MLTPNSPCYLTFFQNGTTRVLSPGKVTETYDNTASVQFPQKLDLKAGGKTTFYANWRGKFYSQSVTVKNVTANGGNSNLAIETNGDPVLCSEEENFRVSTISHDVRMTVEKQMNCQLADIGEDGLSVITQQPLQTGGKVTINLTVDGIYAQGQLTVTGQQKLPDGQTAFTLEVGGKKNPLHKSLESVSATLQRRTLRKLAAA